MKIKFIDKKKSLIDKVNNLGLFECYCDDIFNYDGVIVTASNPNFDMIGGLDYEISNHHKYKEACKKRNNKEERIDNVIFTITVDKNKKSNKELIREALKTIRIYGKKDDVILLSGIGTGIGGLPEDDFVDVVRDFYPRKGYKAFSEGLICIDYKFELGKEFIYNGEIKLGSSGFHYCEELDNVYIYHKPKNTIICEVEPLGFIDTDGIESVTNKIKIVKQLNNYEILKLRTKNNKGYGNLGYYNNGNNNIGYNNCGNENIGNDNVGNNNFGNKNIGYNNKGENNEGDRNEGYNNLGSDNRGDHNNGDYNIGILNKGGYNHGHGNKGVNNLGKDNIGNNNNGSNNKGNNNNGSNNKGNNNNGDYNNGDNNE